MGGRITLLFLGSTPSRTSRMRVGAEAAQIKSALRRGQDRFAFDENHAVRLDELQGIVIDAAAQIVHFAGHGSDAGELIFEDHDGNARTANPAALAQLFHLAGHTTRLVVLNACYSLDQAMAIAEHVDVVIGMSAAIPDRTAIAFSSALYAHLARGASVGRAFELAKNNASLQNLPGDHMPQLEHREGIDPDHVLLLADPAPARATARPDRAAPRRHVHHDLRARDTYLRNTRRHVENLIAESIHNARFLDLGIHDSPVATRLPWVYQRSDAAQAFDRIEDAFQHHHRRLLVLGAPGAGKTVTLLHLAHRLLDEADADPEAPVPLLVNLSRFRFAAPASRGSFPWSSRHAAEPRQAAELGPAAASAPDRSFDAWLVGELADRSVPRAAAQRWLDEGRVAALLDGLDEAHDERRSALAALLNATFLRDHDDTVVVICSRIDEYLPVQGRARLELPGAVTLQPLTPAQIDAYLEAAKASGLREALGRDETLRDLAQTPLTLSMMTLAYGGMVAATIPSHQLLADQRHHLMESYVTKMLQRKERRDRGIPFDDDPEREIPPAKYRYRPALVDRYLSWLAVRLSMRMQTACSMRRFFGFLELRAPADEERLTSRIMRASRIALLAVLIAAMAIAFAPASGAGAIGTGAAVLGGCALYLGLLLKGPDQHNRELLRVPVLVVAALLWFGAVSHSLSALHPDATAGGPGLIALSTVVAALCPLVAIVHNRRVWLVAAGAVLGLAVGVAAVDRHVVPWPADVVVAATMVSGETIAILVVILRDTGLRRAAWLPIGAALLANAALVTLQGGFLLAFDAYPWQLDLGLACSSIVAMLWLIEKPAGAATGWVAAAWIGNVLGGSDLVVLTGAGYGVVLLGVVVLATGDRAPLGAFLDMLRDRFERAADRWVLTPTSRALLALARVLPGRVPRFLRYAGQALVLKPFLGEIEFVHRRLRDYFALRELIPQLQAQDLDRRSEVIGMLGFQGVSAIETLVELIAEGSVDERAAAVRALGRISAPEVAGHLRRALADPAPSVRRAAVLTVHNVSSEEAQAMLRSVVEDPDADVIKAVIDVAFSETNNQLARSPLYELPDSFLVALTGRLLAPGAPTRDFVRHLANRGLSISWSFRWSMIRIGKAVWQAAPDVVRELLADPVVRMRACGCGWMRGSLRASDIKLLVLRLREDSDGLVRSRAAEALGGASDEGAVLPLLEALRDRDPSVRSEAARALGTCRDERALEPLIHASADRSPSVRIVALQALGCFPHTRAVEVLVRALRDARAVVRMFAARVLAASGDPRAIEPLLRALVDRDASVRQVVAAGLGELQDARSVEPLVGALADGHRLVRHAAAVSLGSLRDSRAVEVLVRALADKDEAVRHAAAASLGSLRDTRAVEALVRALADADSNVCNAAAMSLGSLGDARAVEPLVTALEDKGSRVRGSAARSLGLLRDPRAVEPLLAVLSEEDEDLRVSAARALGDLQCTRALGPLSRLLGHVEGDPPHTIPRSSASALLEHVVYELRTIEAVSQLTSSDPETRGVGAGALNTLWGGCAPPLLFRARFEGGVDLEDSALGTLAPREAAVEPLQRALQDPRAHVRRAAAQVLGALGDARAAEPLLSALDDASAEVRTAATVSLCALRDARCEDAALRLFAHRDGGTDYRAWGLLTGFLAQLDSPRAQAALRIGLSDESPERRAAAVEVLASGRSRAERVLLSRDCDGYGPGIDPRDPIGRERIAKCAATLRTSSELVRAHYERLAEELGLTLTWT